MNTAIHPTYTTQETRKTDRNKKKTRTILDSSDEEEAKILIYSRIGILNWMKLTAKAIKTDAPSL